MIDYIIDQITKFGQLILKETTEQMRIQNYSSHLTRLTFFVYIKYRREDRNCDHSCQLEMCLTTDEG